VVRQEVADYALNVVRHTVPHPPDSHTQQRPATVDYGN
jgi:hypothetical protein